MKYKIYLIYFSMMLFVINNSISILISSAYALKTNPIKTGNKVCLIIIDGLRYDTSLKMPFINSEIKKNGILYKACCDVPSLSRPGYERLLTGSETLINGFNSNENFMPSLIPDLFLLSKKQKLKTSAIAYYWVHQMFPANIDYTYFYYFDDKNIYTKSKEIIKSYSPDFLIIHPMEIDNMGHKYGGISKEYMDAAYTVDNAIKNLWDLLNKNNYTIIITSDHGQLDTGGHGGNDICCIQVPIFIFGSYIKNISHKNNLSIKQIDIAPTICDILGIPKTIYMTGNSLVKNDDMQNIRNVYSIFKTDNFNSFFINTNMQTFVIMIIYNTIYFSCWFLLIKFSKQYL